MSALGAIARAGLAYEWLSPKERAVLMRIGDCRTGRLGSNVMACACGYLETRYNSCRDRHCPLCQGAARARWVRDRLEELLLCAYFHVVFTVPRELRGIFHANKALAYGALFRSAQEALLEVGAREENLGARLGGLCVLHTWNQRLAYHPHLHCIVSGGGPSLDGDRWVSGEACFLLPVRRLSRVFRGKLLGRLEAMHREGLLYANDPCQVTGLLKKAACKDFVVYAKRPFGGPGQVLKYLGRYTHRVGISEGRIKSFEGGAVRFEWSDRARGYRKAVMSLTHEAFLKKFLLHLLPRGMRKIRYFGFMANRGREEGMASARRLLEQSGFALGEDEREEPKREEPSSASCPRCGGALVLVLADGWRSCPDTLARRLVLGQYMRAGGAPKVEIASTG